MRSTLFFLAAVALAQTAPEKSAITGRVVSSSTGTPLKKASVWLEPFSPTRGVNGERSVALPSTTTDAEGRFTIDGVQPGSYLLMAHRVGYLDQGYGAPAPQIIGPPLVVNAGETKRGLILTLTAQSLLYGKVVVYFYDKAGKLQKTLYTKRIKTIEGQPVIVETQMVNKQTGHTTEMVVDSLRARKDLPDAAFTPTALEHG